MLNGHECQTYVYITHFLRLQFFHSDDLIRSLDLHNSFLRSANRSLDLHNSLFVNRGNDLQCEEPRSRDRITNFEEDSFTICPFKRINFYFFNNPFVPSGLSYKNQVFVSRHVWHEKDPSLLKDLRCRASVYITGMVTSPHKRTFLKRDVKKAVNRTKQTSSVSLNKHLVVKAKKKREYLWIKIWWIKPREKKECLACTQSSIDKSDVRFDALNYLPNESVNEKLFTKFSSETQF